MNRVQGGVLLWRLLVTAATVLVVSAFLFSPTGNAFVMEVVRATHWIGAMFQVANASTPIVQVLLPTALCTAFVYCMMLIFPKGGRWPRVAVILLLISLYTVYILFRAFVTLNLDSWTNAIFSVLFFLAEILIYLKAVTGNVQMLWLTDRRADADRSAELIRSRRYLPNVDIFIPTYSEPVELLRRTILGCQNLSYPSKTIYLLDDKRRPEMRALARELRCEYRDRADHREAKAGNLNAALRTTRGELIAVFDADFIPTRDFLERTLGFFIDPEVGLVQTPQNFYNVDAIARNLGLSGIITEEQQLFMRAAQPGRDTFGAIICHGTSFVVRRSALAELGNFPGETLTEDWATSIKLQAAGYKTYYLNELLSSGLAADSIGEFASQRLRWCRGTLQAFFASTNPITIPGLKLRQRLLHLCGPINYLPYLSRVFCLLLPLLFFFFGILPLNTSAEMLLAFFLPYWACQLLALGWLTRGHRSAFWSEVYDTLLAWPMTVTILKTFVRPFGKAFKVSAKHHKHGRLTFHSSLGMPLIILILLYVPALLWAISHIQWYPSQTVFLLAIGWSLYSLLLIWLSLQATLDVPHPDVHLGFKHRVPALIRFRNQVWSAMTAEISDTEVVLDIEPSAVKELMDEPMTIAIPALGLAQVPVRLRTTSGTPTLVFEHLPLPQHRKLIDQLFCRPGQWDDRGVSESLTLWHFLAATFRMYPLAEAK